MDENNKKYLNYLFENAKWITCCENDTDRCTCVQGSTAKYVNVMEGYTDKAGVAVIANQLQVVASTLLQARMLLFMAEKEAQCQFTINGLLVSVFMGMQSVMDCIATFCQHHEPDEQWTDDKIYFDQYTFISSKVSFIRNQRTKMQELRFNDQDYNYWANVVKHNCTWFGMVSVDERSGLADIYDSDRRGLYQDMIIPLFDNIRQIIERLGFVYHQPLCITKV